MTRRFTRPVALATLVAPLLGSGSAMAAGPHNGARYAGMIVERSAREHRLPISFVVSGDGRQAASFSMPDGMPASDTCAAGPLGTPVSHPTPIAHGAFDATFKLGHVGARRIGTARIWGTFGPRGGFTGHFTNGSQIRPCDATFRFTAHAG
jgi:hypothetical protein